MLPASPDSLFEAGLAHHRAGRFEQAALHYERALAAAPRHADALHLLGLVRLALGATDEGIALIRRCLALQPRFAEAHNNLGTALASGRRWPEAIAAYSAALKINPHYAEACNNLGIALQAHGRLPDAITAFHRALSLAPALHEAHNNLGIALEAAGRLDEATAAYRRATTLQPGYAAAFANLGKALQASGQPAAAVDACRQAIALQPNLADAHANLGAALRSLGRYTEAAAAFRQALALAPGSASAHSNLGAALERLGDYDGALAAFAQALTLDPAHADAHNNLGYTLRALNRYDEAMVHYAAALRVAPGFAGARFNLGLAQLVTGDFANGGRNFEARWDCEQRAARRDFRPPLWLGDTPLAGKRILLHAEQGLGDTLQFCRFAPLVAAQGATVLLEVQSALKPLLGGLPGVATLLGRGEPLPPFDCHCPLLSLPLALRTGSDTVPPPVPLAASEAGRMRWQKILGRSPRRRVGVAWSGNPLHRGDQQRSIPLALFRTLTMGWPAIEFYCLQNAVRDTETPLETNAPEITELARQGIHSFDDTAAIVAEMDLVIAVDTASAHLVGTMGRPLWLLLPFCPDWRWRLERSDTPWYPSARLFRQPRPGDWAPVLAAVRTELLRRDGAAATVAG